MIPHVSWIQELITPKNGERVGQLTPPHDPWDRLHHGLDLLHFGETELFGANLANSDLG